ncbi:helix-turn-helix transcriptional regulator [Candidatus Regiella insecticola]|uniref:helix-turn-helix transcriptional regulator n=1 Tax=Candidatus Regiella insecticola TaxID=138073 RepID=UPI00387E4FA5
MTSKNIGNILCLSPRTIEHALERLYNKAGVNHIEDFISFCEKHDFHRYLPHKFLQINAVCMLFMLLKALTQAVYDDFQFY